VKLEHSFTVPAPVDQAWAALLDIEGVAPCMPGAVLTGVDGDEFSGTVKVKLGPVSLSYSGKGRFLERDDVAHTVVIDATGRDKNGNGTAGASVHARMEPDGADSTKVVVVTDLKITGRPAQFGRGVMQDVGGKIIGQFADCLAATMATPADHATPGADAPAPTTDVVPGDDVDASDGATTGAPSAAPTIAAATAPVGGTRPAAPRPQPVRSLPTSSGTAPAAELDLGSAVLPVLLRRFGPPALVAVVAALVAWLLVRRRR
jgi:carbon monoxide dehydrogenase subunit G